MTTRSRRVTAAAVATAAILALTACSTPDRDTASAGASGGKKTLKTLSFVNPLPDIAVWKQIGTCMGDEAKKKGLTYSESGPPSSKPGDPTVMIQQVQAAVAKGADAVVTFPASGAFGPVLQQAQRQGVLTATLYGDGSAESGATVNAGVDWTVIGKQYVDAIAALPGDHVVGLVAEAPTGIGKSWTDGVKAAASATSNVKVIDTVYIGADASKASPQVTNLLTANPDIDIVASNTGLMTQGAVTAIEQKGLKGKVRIVGINNANGGPEAMRDGYAVGLFLQDLCDLATRTVDGIVESAETGKSIPLIGVNDVVASTDNMQSYLDKGWN